MADKKSSPKNGRTLYITAGWLLIILTTALCGGISVPRYEVRSDKVSEPVRIVLLADLHSSYYGPGQEVLLRTVEEQSPDVILLAGDIFEEIRPHEHSVETLAALGEKYPCYYVTGNHEEATGEVSEIKKIVRDCGVTVLEGTGEIFHGIRICGADNSLPDTQFEDCVRMAGDDVFTVMMCHRPDRADEYSGKGFGLVVCGHAHGGQVIIPGLLNGLYAPDQGFFPEYAGGEYLLPDGSTSMIVSRGLCRNILPRVFNPPEAAVIDILPEERD